MSKAYYLVPDTWLSDDELFARQQTFHKAVQQQN